MILKHVSLIEQIQVTRSIIKFCRDRAVPLPSEIVRCLAALESEEVHVALLEAYSVQMEGMGSFTDAWPKPMPGEDNDYAFVLFVSLAFYWNSKMRQLDVVIKDSMARFGCL